MTKSKSDFQLSIQSKDGQLGKALILSICKRALLDAGFTKFTIETKLSDAMSRMDPVQLENVRNNDGELFDKEIEFVLKEKPLNNEYKELAARQYSDD
jgi:hypothetical protein